MGAQCWPIGPYRVYVNIDSLGTPRWNRHRKRSGVRMATGSLRFHDLRKPEMFSAAGMTISWICCISSQCILLAGLYHTASIDILTGLYIIIYLCVYTGIILYLLLCEQNRPVNISWSVIFLLSRLGYPPPGCELFFQWLSHGCQPYTFFLCIWAQPAVCVYIYIYIYTHIYK